jgi:hypothetical protein
MVAVRRGPPASSASTLFWFIFQTSSSGDAALSFQIGRFSDEGTKVRAPATGQARYLAREPFYGTSSTQVISTAPRTLQVETPHRVVPAQAHERVPLHAVGIVMHL